MLHSPHWRWASSACPRLLCHPITVNSVWFLACHGAHTSPNQMARIFFFRFLKKIDLTSKALSEWAIRIKWSSLDQSDIFWVWSHLVQTWPPRSIHLSRKCFRYKEHLRKKVGREAVIDISGWGKQSTMYESRHLISSYGSAINHLWDLEQGTSPHFSHL